MIYLKLFLTFLEIGAVSFGGGYAMISMVRDKVLSHGWMSEAEFLNMIAVSESTPGPIAINMATFVGSKEGGILGSALATLGVVLPSFIIILIIASVIKNLLKYKGVRAFIDGIRPAVVGLILATAATLFLGNILNLDLAASSIAPDYRALIIFAIVALIAAVFKKIKKKKPSAILMIIISAFLGMAAYSI